MKSNNNFKCPKTGKEFSIPICRVFYINGSLIYKDKWGKELINPDNGEKLVPIPKDVNFNGAGPFFGTGKDSAGRAKIQEMLKKRSKEHFKKEISQRKYELNKGLVKKFKNKYGGV